MNAIIQCQNCKQIFKYTIVDDKVPIRCGNCAKEIRDDGGFLINGIYPDDMYSLGPEKKDGM